MANLSFSNVKFHRTVKRFREVMPAMAVILLALVYLIAAVAEGLFLGELLKETPVGIYLAFGISIAIQATRGLLVFFPQLNPNRPAFGNQGEIIAVVMGLIAIGSVWGVVGAIGLHHAVGISLSILMLAGVGVEIYFLKEIKYATETELAGDKQYWEEMKNFAYARREFKQFLSALEDYEPSPDQLLSSFNSPSPTPPPDPIRRTFSEAVLNAIGGATGLTAEQMNAIRLHIDDGRTDDEVIAMINGFSENNRKRQNEDSKYYNNGKSLSQQDLYTLYRDYQKGLVAEKPLTDDQKKQIMDAAKRYGVDLDPALFDQAAPLDMSRQNGSGSHH